MQTTLSAISGYIHAQGVSQARNIISAYYAAGRIDTNSYDWLLSVWGIHENENSGSGNAVISGHQ